MRISDLVLLNDHHVIALNKPPGLPVQEDRTGDASLHRLAQAYCKRDLYILNRLDRPCSGVVLMAKSKADAALLTAQWEERTVDKRYLAIVSPGILPKQGSLRNRLEKHGNKSLVSEATEGPGNSIVTLSYRVLGSLDNYDIIEVEAQTGYFHQIRAQLAAAGYPVKGDIKYGARRGNKDRSICLHGSALTFIHPGSGEKTTIQAVVPATDIWPACESILKSNNT